MPLLAKSSSRPPEPPKVLVFVNGGCRPDFIWSFTHTLDRLGCGIRIASSWKEYCEFVQEQLDQAPILLVDPVVSGFNEHDLRQILEPMPPKKRPKVVFLTREANALGWNLQQQYLDEFLDAAGKMHDGQTLQEIAFVLNRMLYPRDLDKRRHPRALTRFPVKYSNYKNRDIRAGMSLNLSAGGIFVETVESVPQGSFLDLEMYLPDHWGIITCTGRVAFSYQNSDETKDLFPSGMGIRFRGMDSRDVQRVIHYATDRLLRIDRLGLYKAP